MIPIWKIIKNSKITYVQPILKHLPSRKEHWHVFVNKPLGITDGFEALFEKKWIEKDEVKINKDKLQKDITKIEKSIFK